MASAREIVKSIWEAGVRAVDSARLVDHAIRLTPQSLDISELSIPLADLKRIEIVGAGKAGAGMAAGAESALAGLKTPMAGWVNVPADCVRPLKSVHLHPARPSGLNEPTAAGVSGSEEILRRVSQLGSGESLLPCPQG